MLKLLDRFSNLLNRVLVWIGGVFLCLMILLTCANIFLRTVWFPIRGTFELMGYFGAVVTAFALGYTQLSKGHIAVDIVVMRFPKGLKRVTEAINSILLCIFFSFVTYQIARFATNLKDTGEVSETLRIIYYPFSYATAFGCGALAFVFFVELLKSIFQKENAR